MIQLRLLSSVASPIGWRSLFALVAAGALLVQMQRPATIIVPPLKMKQSAISSEHSRTRSAAGSADYSAIAENPLFSPSRRPWVPPPRQHPILPATRAPARPALPPPRGYTLVGIVLSNRTRTALLRPATGGKTIFLRKGQELGGWTLQSVTDSGLHFDFRGVGYDLTFPGWWPSTRGGRLSNR
jgi:hypothetical protein